jgi:hypothetical protein
MPLYNILPQKYTFSESYINVVFENTFFQAFNVFKVFGFRERFDHTSDIKCSGKHGISATSITNTQTHWRHWRYK